MNTQIKILALSFSLASASFALETAEGMFSGALPSNFSADVVASLQFSRNHYDNWNDGKDGTNNSLLLLKYDADVKGHFTHVDLRNVAKLLWGRTYTEGLGSRKSQDEIFLETTLSENDFGVIKPYAGLRFESQFAKGYKYSDTTDRVPVSCFMDPGYFTQFIGLSYVPNDNFMQGFAFANRMTFSDGYGYADDKDTKKVESFKNEPGFESITEYKVKFSSIFSFKTRLWAFVNFKGVDEIDGKWENDLEIALVPLLVLSLGVDLAYDKDISVDSEYRDAVNIGIVWRWF